MCGNTNLLLALGGAQGAIKNTDLYLVNSNKWKRFPHLLHSTKFDGSCMLPSLRVFCFHADSKAPEKVMKVQNI